MSARPIRRFGVLMALAAASLALLASPAAAHRAQCIENVNPHGQNIPPAGFTTLPGPQGGQNEDGFWKIFAAPKPVKVFVKDLGSGTVFGPYPSGTVVKYTEANGAKPRAKKIGSTNGQAGAVLVHINGTGDMGVYSVDDRTITRCLVPPPPK